MYWCDWIPYSNRNKWTTGIYKNMCEFHVNVDQKKQDTKYSIYIEFKTKQNYPMLQYPMVVWVGDEQRGLLGDWKSVFFFPEWWIHRYACCIEIYWSVTSDI